MEQRWPRRPMIEPMLRIRPQPEVMIGSSASVQLTAPPRLTRRTCSSRARVRRSIPVMSRIAALLTRMCRAPKRSLAMPASCSTEAGSAMSTWVATAARPARRSWFASASAGSVSMSASTTAAPSRARRVAMARPIPRAAPVTIAALPASRRGLSIRISASLPDGACGRRPVLSSLLWQRMVRSPRRSARYVA
jgi:hypothetical protein